MYKCKELNLGPRNTSPSNRREEDLNLRTLDYQSITVTTTATSTKLNYRYALCTRQLSRLRRESNACGLKNFDLTLAGQFLPPDSKM